MNKKMFENMTIDQLLELRYWLQSRRNYHRICRTISSGADSIARIYVDDELGKRYDMSKTLE